MKALSLTQPWATLVAIGAKRIETRSWPTKYRGPLAIHAAKGFPAWAKDMCGSHLVTGLLGWPKCPNPPTQEWIDDNSRRIKTLPLGQIIACCKVANCLDVNLIERFVQPFTEQERRLGDYDPGRYGWLLEDIVPVEPPVFAKGALGLWECSL